MGPIIIFDKSVLESLNPDEAMWLDNFFLSNITPLFFIETLADLEKEVRKGRTPEQVVGSLAYKTPDMSSKLNVYHKILIEGELHGFTEVDMKYGRPIVPKGKVKELEGKTGIIFEPSPEEEAFSRWQKYEFLELERSLAKSWRHELSNINLQKVYDFFQKFFPIGKPKTLEDVKKYVDFHINEPDQKAVLIFCLSLLDISLEAQKEIIARWEKSGKLPIS